ncbi:site-specific integrase [Streptomyces globisporus]|uniref:site-specific integrase n=1 Tax=Streptomyces globisporus TaxID=1908 RepID=UPI0036BA8911
MATINLVRGMGSFFKECEHPESRWPRCPHDDKIPYSNAAGRQAEESGFSAQDPALQSRRMGTAQLHGIRAAGDDVFRFVADLMSGCGMRNGEAPAVSINNIVANNAYRITEQVNQTTKTYAPLKHRKVGDYRDVSLPARVKHSIEWYADTYGTIDGYLLRSPRDLTKPMLNYGIGNQRQRMKKAGLVDIPEGMVVYGFRHFFASNCLILVREPDGQWRIAAFHNTGGKPPMEAIGMVPSPGSTPPRAGSRIRPCRSGSWNASAPTGSGSCTSTLCPS